MTPRHPHPENHGWHYTKSESMDCPECQPEGLLFPAIVNTMNLGNDPEILINSRKFLRVACFLLPDTYKFVYLMNFKKTPSRREYFKSEETDRKHNTNLFHHKMIKYCFTLSL